jgi:hypothetical protein
VKERAGKNGGEVSADVYRFMYWHALILIAHFAVFLSIAFVGSRAVEKTKSPTI